MGGPASSTAKGCVFDGPTIKRREHHGSRCRKSSRRGRALRVVAGARKTTRSRGHLYRSYATTVEDLWDAESNGERIPRWFLPISGELELGGRYRLEGNAGGVITACEQLSYFALTWEFGEDVSWVEVRFSDDRQSRARLTLTHTAHLSEHRDEYGLGAAGVSWELGFLGLAIQGMGASSGRGRYGTRGRACGGKSHDRVLHWGIGRAYLMHGHSRTFEIRKDTEVTSRVE